MATPTKKSTVKKSATKKSIPSAIRDDGKKKKSRLRRTAGSRTAKTTAKKDRPEIQVTDDTLDAFREWAPLKVIYDLFATHCKNSRNSLDELLWDIYTESMWANKSQPQNPAIRANGENGRPDLEATYVVTARFKIQVPEGSEDEEPEDVMISKLQEDASLSEENATALVVDEMDFEPASTINLTALVHGKKEGKTFRQATDVQISAGEKLMDYLEDGGELDLSDKEREAVSNAREDNFTVGVNGGFLERACNYAESLEQLRDLFDFIKPVTQLRGVKVGVSDSEDTKSSRLVQKAAEILGIEFGVEAEEE